jgi:hypothetical protein
MAIWCASRKGRGLFRCGVLGVGHDASVSASFRLSIHQASSIKHHRYGHKEKLPSSPATTEIDTNMSRAMSCFVTVHMIHTKQIIRVEALSVPLARD